MPRSSLIVALVAAAATLSTPSWAAEPAAASDPSAPPANTGREGATSEAPVVTIGGNAGPGALKKDEAQAATGDDAEKEPGTKWRGTAIVFDQSVTTQTVRLGDTPQSYIPTYEWWISFRPRYYFTKKVYVSGRFDFFKEIGTNSEDNDKFQENVFGDVWANAVYESTIPALSKNTKGSVAARFIFPTSKATQNIGTYVRTGVAASVRQTLPINGESAKVFNSARLGLGVWYDHPWQRATSPVNPNFARERQDLSGTRSVPSDQPTGKMNVANQLVTTFDAGLEITPKLSFTADMIFLQTWRYKAPEACVPTAGECTPVEYSPNDTGYGVNTWFLTSVDYQLLDEVSLGLGYYNLANQLGPDGKRRNVIGPENLLWSPEARIFFDVTANLDKIYEWATGKQTSGDDPSKTSAERKVARLPSAFTAAQGL